MANSKKKQRPTPQPRDWNLVGLIARAGGKGRHKSKKHKPRATNTVALKKSLMDDRSSHGAFLCAAVLL
jgi:hypothetical protein